MIETDLMRRRPTWSGEPQWRLAGIIFFGLLALLLLYAAFKILWPFMTAILLGAILVILTFNLFRRVRIDDRRAARHRAAIVMLLGITFVIVIPALILVDAARAAGERGGREPAVRRGAGR